MMQLIASGRARAFVAIGVVFFAVACGRKVSVDDSGSPAHVQPPAGSADGSAGAARVGAAGSSASAGQSGSDSNMGGAGSADAGGSDAGDPSSGTGGSAQGVLASGVDQAKVTSDSAIELVQVLVDSLTNTDVPAVGREGVSIMQYPKTDVAAVLFVDWSGATSWSYESDHAYHIYTAANGDRSLSLVYAMSAYGIYQDRADAELSGMPSVYKEFLAANSEGYAWVDYPSSVAGKKPTQSLGSVVFQSWAGARSTLTDDQRYRARIDLSQKHVAFVEYASTAPGAVGQIMVQPIDGSPAIAAAPSANHQDRPAIDGDWVVWEEYLNDADSVIRARNLVSGEVRDISAHQGFRTNPDILGTRVIWEDQRGGDADIYFVDLASTDGERIAVSGRGYSTTARLASDGLVWIEISGNAIGLLRASWIRP